MQTSIGPKWRLMLATMVWLAAGAADAESDDAGMLYAPFQQLLERHLTETPLHGGGLISAFDYAAAFGDHDTEPLLAEQDRRLAAVRPASDWRREQALAFWINAYNYFMIAHILRHPKDGRPVDSVREFGHLFDPYAVFGRELFDVGGQAYSLRQIELEILLGDDFAERGWKDARVHFMVNCASVGCPPLRREVYDAANIDRYLAENTRAALATPLHLRRDGRRLHVTSLFDWYRDDFVESAGSIEAFIEIHGGPVAREALSGHRQIRFIDYDWSLNSPENFEALDIRRAAADAPRAAR